MTTRPALVALGALLSAGLTACSSANFGGGAGTGGGKGGAKNDAPAAGGDAHVATGGTGTGPSSSTGGKTACVPVVKRPLPGATTHASLPSLPLDPAYAGQYSAFDLGTPDGVPPPFGFLAVSPTDPSTLLVGGNANDASGVLMQVGLDRDAQGHIVGYTGPATKVADLPYNDGGVAIGKNGLLLASQWPENKLSELRPGAATPDKVVDFVPLGVATSNAALGFVPAGFPGAGHLKLVSWKAGEWYDAAYSLTSDGLYDVTGATQVAAATLDNGPEGFAFIPHGSPGFGKDSLIVSEWSAGDVVTYELDPQGNPVVPSRKLLIDNLEGAEGAFFDPATGDFLFSTFGAANGDHLAVIRGFNVPPPVDGLVTCPTP